MTFPAGSKSCSAAIRWIILYAALNSATLTFAQGDITPTGAAGGWGGTINTGGGSFDPYERNASRSITDMVVPGAVVPLTYTRIWNSCGSWQHNWQWQINTWESSECGPGCVPNDLFHGYNIMKIAKAHLVVAVLFFMGIMSAPVSLGQTPVSTLIPSKDVSGNDRYPLPKEGLVPDKETAIKIAEAVLFRLYGEDSIKLQRPYVVKEADYIWSISGTLPKDNFGEVFNIGISKHTAAVLRLTLGEDKLAGGK